MLKTTAFLIRWPELSAKSSQGNVSVLGMFTFSFMIKFCSLHCPTSVNSPHRSMLDITSVFMQNPGITGNFQHLVQPGPSSGLKHFIYLYLLSLCKSGYFRVFCYYRNTHRSGRCNSLPLSSHPPVVVLTAMTFSGSIGLPLRREGYLGNVSCLLEQPRLPNTRPSLHGEQVPYFTVTSCATP